MGESRAAQARTCAAAAAGRKPVKQHWSNTTGQNLGKILVKRRRGPAQPPPDGNRYKNKHRPNTGQTPVKHR
jgi:hypothetical protein